MMRRAASVDDRGLHPARFAAGVLERVGGDGLAHRAVTGPLAAAGARFALQVTERAGGGEVDFALASGQGDRRRGQQIGQRVNPRQRSASLDHQRHPAHQTPILEDLDHARLESGQRRRERVPQLRTMAGGRVGIEVEQHAPALGSAIHETGVQGQRGRQRSSVTRLVAARPPASTCTK
jgi:hypothetical protein